MTSYGDNSVRFRIPEDRFDRLFRNPELLNQRIREIQAARERLRTENLESDAGESISAENSESDSEDTTTLNYTEAPI